MTKTARCATLLSMAVLAGTAVLAPATAAERVSKDIGPVSAAGCDAAAKGSAAWMACVGAAKAGMSDTELFYAGYWLAKSGQYEKALSYLKLAAKQDERVLTYIGFSTRKLGDVEGALPLYEKALALNPNYTVARAYMGEAFLTKGEPAKAKAQLAEIATRCGTTCPEYVDLDRGIAAFEAATKKG